MLFPLIFLTYLFYFIDFIDFIYFIHLLQSFQVLRRYFFITIFLISGFISIIFFILPTDIFAEPINDAELGQQLKAIQSQLLINNRQQISEIEKIKKIKHHVMESAQNNVTQTDSQNAQALFFAHHSNDMNESYFTNKKKNSPAGMMLFVSLGMPDLVLRQYLRQAHRYHIPIIIRGLIKNDFKVTINRLNALLTPLNEKPIAGGVEIDPLYFKEFHITQVPALVAYQHLPNCQHENCPFVQHDVIYGNIPLAQSLVLIEKNGKVAAKVAQQYLEESKNEQ